MRTRRTDTIRRRQRRALSSRGIEWAAADAALILVAALALAGTGRATTPSFFWANPTPQGNELSTLVFENDQLGYTVGLRGTCLLTTDGGVSWTDQTRFPAFTTDLMDAVEMGPGDLIAVGGAPGIFRSTDGGASWTPVPNPSTSKLTNIFRVNASILSTVGDAGSILRSTDDGATWQIQPPPVAGANLLNQYWRSPTDGYVIGVAVLRHTSNGGATWQTIPGTNEAQVFFGGDVQFLDAMNGWIMVDFTTYRTTDGGATWFEKNPQFGQGPIYPKRSVIVDTSTRYVTTDGEGAQVWKTVDDGLNWTVLYQRVNTRGYTDIIGLNGGGLVAVSSDGDLIRSIDGGLTWTNFTRSPGEGERELLAAVALMPNGVGFAAGGSVWLRTTNDGATWDFAPAHPDFTGGQVIRFLGSSLGLAAGSSGGQSEVSRTTDGGASWTSHLIDNSYVGYPADIDIVDSSVCYAALYGGTNIGYVYKSADGGQSWTRRSTGVPSSVRLFSIDFIDAQTGYVGGGDVPTPSLYRTTDGGAQWTSVNTAGLGSSEIQAMHWFDAQTGLVSSFQGTYRTTNGGQSWSAVQTGENITLSFADDHVGYGASLFTPYVRRTTDAGLTWEPIEIPWSTGPQQICATQDGFLAIGHGSGILRAHIVDPASAGDPDAFASAGTGGLKGSLGPGVRVRALPTSGRATVFLEIDASEAPDRTTAPSGWIADGTGRHVADLSSSAIGASRWRMTWDPTAELIPSGVFFAVLDRGGNRASLKRIVLR